MSFIDDLRYNYEYNVKTNFTYPQWMRYRFQMRGIGFIADRQTRELVASIDDLKEIGLQVSKNMADGNELLSGRLSDVARTNLEVRESITDLDNTVRKGLSGIESEIRDSSREIVSALEWGFSDLSERLGVLDEGINNLVVIGRNPSATDAYEQFRWAQDEARRGLYAEALRSIRVAINGDHRQRGLDTGDRSAAARRDVLDKANDRKNNVGLR